ncbi:chemotaxis protein [Alteromonas antoniana]|uniref:chemotaxis protein n=1 Tax=Alteromonas antoniana TaxID=2803813 RepID=UPI001C486369|nr:chemotaxis protein [Alteromonas antoniana]
MRFDSIKSRLALMTCVCVLGMGLLVGSQHYFSEQQYRLQQQQSQLLRMGQDLLQMRRHEKDFLLRHNPRYFERFSERADTLNGRLQTIAPLFATHDLPQEQATQLAKGLYQYQQLFQQVVSLQTQIGLSPAQGELYSLSNTEQKLLRQPDFGYGSVIRTQFDEARLAVRNYQLSRDSFYREKAEQTLSKLADRLEPDTAAVMMLQEYRGTFTRLADAYHTLGVTHNDGLRGQFRRQAHHVEALLQRIDQALQPILEKQQQQVKLYSLTIAGLASVALLLILVKSFATFHRAFANFVMFFYRCKRQYQKMDPRQLGFAEFKSLAELANEMVESRRDIEHKLANAEAELASARENLPERHTGKAI